MRFTLRELDNLREIKELASKCVTNQKTNYSFSDGASAVKWWQDEPAVKVYEVLFNNDGVGLIAGQKFKYGNNYYFFLNQLGRYATKVFNTFTIDCLDAIIMNDKQINAVVLHPVNDLLKEHYLKAGATILNPMIGNSMAEFVNRKCELLYPRSKAFEKYKKEEPVYEYLGTYVGNSGVGTNGGGYGKNPYFIYQILDLNSTLSQKGNSSKAAKFYLLVGDKVKGICALDNKEHTGLIQRFYVDEKSTDMKPTYIYILDTNSVVVPLYPKTIVKLVNRSRGSVDPHSHPYGQYPGLF